MERCYIINLFSVLNLFFSLDLLPDFHEVIVLFCSCINFSAIKIFSAILERLE